MARPRPVPAPEPPLRRTNPSKIRSQPAGQGEAAVAGQAHVEDGEVRRAGEDGVGMHRVGEPAGGKPLLAQTGEDRLAHGRLVLHHDHTSERSVHGQPILLPGG